MTRFGIGILQCFILSRLFSQKWYALTNFVGVPLSRIVTLLDQNLHRALHWYRIAAQKGSEEGEEKMKAVETELKQAAAE